MSNCSYAGVSARWDAGNTIVVPDLKENANKILGVEGMEELTNNLSLG
jgi:hypothetical protein